MPPYRRVDPKRQKIDAIHVVIFREWASLPIDRRCPYSFVLLPRISEDTCPYCLRKAELVGKRRSCSSCPKARRVVVWIPENVRAFRTHLGEALLGVGGEGI